MPEFVRTVSARLRHTVLKEILETNGRRQTVGFD